MVKKWETAWLKVTSREVLVCGEEGASPKMSHPYLEILRIRQCCYNDSRPYCISLQVIRLLLVLTCVDSKNYILVFLEYRRGCSEVVL